MIRNLIWVKKFSVGAGYITTRGCAPFDTETFSVNLQRGMSGTYWKSYDAFSLCENSLCNSAPAMIKNYSIVLSVFLSLICVIYSNWIKQLICNSRSFMTKYEEFIVLYQKKSHLVLEYWESFTIWGILLILYLFH